MTEAFSFLFGGAPESCKPESAVDRTDVPTIAPAALSKPRPADLVVSEVLVLQHMRLMLRRARLLLAATILPTAAPAQSLDLMVHNTGLSIGDSRIVRGVRLNFRDDRLERVTGLNATIWMPYQPARGSVKGMALGLPMTGARRIEGLGIGVFGVGAEQDFHGIGAGLIGVGAGGNVSGLVLAGIGAGAGGNMSGITIGGIGAGAGGNMTGFTFGLIGAGAGGNMKGISIGGIGAGAGGDVTGISIGGVGAGAGGDLTGITVAGVGAGAGGTLRGLTVGLVGAGAPRVRGVALGLNAGGHDVEGGVVAPIYFVIESEKDGDLGRVKGITISSWNRVKGEQFGLSIGLLNTAWELHGWQLGVLNCSRRKSGWFCLPLVNKGS